MAISDIAERLRTQDNRITHNPIFCVQKKVRTYGFDPDYDTDGGCTVWLNPHAGEADAEDTARLNEICERGEDTGEWIRTAYQDRWEFVQPFLTEEGAKEYLRVNGHNVKGETRIYVESGWRNHEWQAVREHLMGLARAEAFSE